MGLTATPVSGLRVETGISKLTVDSALAGEGRNGRLEAGCLSVSPPQDMVLQEAIDLQHKDME